MIDRLWDLPNDSVGSMIGLILIVAIAMWSWRDRRKNA